MGVRPPRLQLDGVDEKLAAADTKLGLFHPENPLASRTLEERIENYADIGKRMDHSQPEKAIELI